VSNVNELIRLAQLGRRAEKRGKALQGCATGLFVSTADALLTGWILMLAVGVAHAEWIRQLPTIGYWWAVVLVALTRGLFRAVSTKTKADQ
jgi:hypothetical protein